LTSQKPSPGNDKVNNIEAAKAQEQQMRDWIRQAADYFQPIAPIPNMDPTAWFRARELPPRSAGPLTSCNMKPTPPASPCRPNTIFPSRRSATLVKFATGSLGLLAVQLGEVKTIAEILFAARVNSLDGIQRVRVSDDDASGPQADYFDDHSVTNNLAVLTPLSDYVPLVQPGNRPGARRLCLVTARIHRQGISVQPAGAAGRDVTRGTRTAPPPPRAGGDAGQGRIADGVERATVARHAGG
jgi:hypothetical protein